MIKKKRIGIVVRDYDLQNNGVTIFAKHLVKFLIENTNNSVEIITNKNEINDKTKITRINVKKISYLKNLNWVFFAYSINKYLQKQNYDLIIFTDAKENYFYNKSPIMSIQHDYLAAEAKWNLQQYKQKYPHDYLKRLIYYNLNKILEKRALNPEKGKIITVSKYTKNKLIKAYSIKSRDIEVIYNGVKYQTTYKNTRVWNKKDITLLFVGGNFQGKGLDILLDQVKNLQCKFKLIIIGRDPLRKKYEQYCIKNRITAEFYEHIDNNEMYNYYLKSDLLIYPSRIDSFPMVILEAMNYNIPIISSNVGGIPEIIINNFNGVIMHINNKNAINQIIKKINNKNILKIKKNQDKTAKKFDRKNTFKKYLKLINKEI